MRKQRIVVKAGIDHSTPLTLSVCSGASTFKVCVCSGRGDVTFGDQSLRCVGICHCAARLHWCSDVSMLEVGARRLNQPRSRRNYVGPPTLLTRKKHLLLESATFVVHNSVVYVVRSADDIVFSLRLQGESKLVPMSASVGWGGVRDTLPWQPRRQRRGGHSHFFIYSTSCI